MRSRWTPRRSPFWHTEAPGCFFRGPTGVSEPLGAHGHPSFRLIYAPSSSSDSSGRKLPTWYIRRCCLPSRCSHWLKSHFSFPLEISSVIANISNCFQSIVVFEYNHGWGFDCQEIQDVVWNVCICGYGQTYESTSYKMAKGWLWGDC